MRYSRLLLCISRYVSEPTTPRVIQHASSKILRRIDATIGALLLFLLFVIGGFKAERLN